MKKIILYGLNEDRKKEVLNILKPLGDVRFIDKRHIENKVGDLFDKEDISEQEIKNEKNEVYDTEFMLIDGFDTEEDLNNILSVFRETDVKRPITSARTIHNQDWILKDLLKEIFDENEYMKKMMRS